ncbi:MAG: hypothetical protein QXE80_09170 [Pyrobaculum sp.]
MAAKNARKMLIREVEELVKQLDTVEKIADFLEGKLTLTCRNKYLLYGSNPAYYYDTHKLLYAVISKNTPLVIRSKQDAENEIASLVPLDEQPYVVIKPDTEVTLQIDGWPGGQITFKIAHYGQVSDACFDDQAVFGSFENFPRSMYHRLVEIMKLVVTLGTINVKDVYARLIAFEYLSHHEFVYEAHAWYFDSLDPIRLLLLETSTRASTGNIFAAATDIPGLILKQFENVMRSVKRVEIFKEVVDDASSKDA